MRFLSERHVSLEQIRLCVLIHSRYKPFIIGPVKQRMAPRDLIYSLSVFLKFEDVRFKNHAVNYGFLTNNGCADWACSAAKNTLQSWVLLDGTSCTGKG